jgi:hypothetical protein
MIVVLSTASAYAEDVIWKRGVPVTEWFGALGTYSLDCV